MENQIYKDPIIQKYETLIKSKTNVFKRIYYGDPIRIPISNLPALVIAKVDTKISNLSNAEDRHDIRISFTVITDIRDTIMDDKTMVPGTNVLYNIMEGRNVDYTLKAESLLNILRNNVELDITNNLRTDLNTMSKVDYALTLGKRKDQAWAIEGMIDISAVFTQVR